ncbi:MAG: OmpA family protein [Archangium sp.]|nr:OmpA family protein [Archangium sp.]
MTKRVVGVVVLALAACAPDQQVEGANEPKPPVAAQRQAVVTAFASGSLIIPMDTTSQNNGTLRAFGLVDRLLRANVPVHRIALTGKPAGGTDFTVTATQRESGAALGSVAYRGGPFVIAAADATAAALLIVDNYLAADTVTNVHVATAAFNADVQRTLLAAPRIAVLRDGSEAIAYTMLNAANITDSTGATWTNASPGALTLAGVAGANGGAFDGTLFAGGQPTYDQLTSMHYDSPANNEVVREIRGWLDIGPSTHAFMSCEATTTFENNVNGRFLSDAGMINDDNNPPTPLTVLQTSSLFAQFDGTLTADTGSVESLGLPAGSNLYANSSVLIAQTGATLGSQMMWLTGYLDGNVNNGKVSYLTGHNYSTTLPISANPQTNGTRLFLDSLYETPAAFSGAQPVIALTKTAPARTNATNYTFTLNYSNTGPATAYSASIVDVLPAGTTFVSATGGGVHAAGTVTWTLGTLVSGASGSVTVTVTSAEGTFANQGRINYQVGLTPKFVLSNSTSTIVDRTSPDTTITAQPPLNTNSTSASFSFTATEAGSTFECSLDGAAFSACTSPQAYAGPLSNGSHTFQVRSTDLTGNVDATPASYTWTVDTIPPDTTITAQPPLISNSATSSFSFTATQAGSTFQCSVDGSAFSACTSAFATGALADGSHTFQVRAIDPAGNVDATPASYTWTIDTVRPDTTITSGPPANSNSSVSTFTFTSTEAGSTFQCSIDGGAFVACSSPLVTAALADGPHTLQVRAIDAAGNVDLTPASRSWTIDTVPPDTSITSGPSGTTASTSATFAFTSPDATATFQCSLDGAPFTACASPNNLTGLADGSHTYQVRAVDPSGNVDPTPASRTWTVDTTAPNTSFTATPPAVSNSANASFSFTSTEAGSTFECSLDGAAFTACTSPRAFTGLSDGSHTMRVRATDAVGNVDATPAAFTWTIDTTPPDTVFTSTPPANSNSTSATFVFNATEAGSTLQCSLDGAAFAACTSPQTLTGLSVGSHTFRARAVDAAGNIDPTPASFTWNVDVTAPDTTFTATPPAASASSNASFSFTSTEAGSTFECSLDGAAFTVCTTPRALSGLTDGSHTFRARAIDPSGNVDATPASFTWTVDTTAPNTTFTATPPAVSNSANASFSFTSTEAGSTFECSLDGAAFTACTSPRAFTGLSDGSHTMRVRATDAVGNTDATPASFTWNIDTTPPDTVFTSTPPASSASSSATFAFNATEAGSTLECSLDGAAFTACTSPTTLTGLADGSHTFRTRATDAAGNVDPTPASFTWTVDTAPPDTSFTSTPPALTSSSTASFAFTSPEAGALFECSLDGAAFTTCTSPQSLSGLADGAHTYRVRAVDALGNADPTPASFTWTVDTTAPDTTIVTGPPASTSSQSATLTFTSSEAGSTFECSLDGAAFSACTSPLVVNGLAEGAHTVRVRSIDAAGNVDPTPATHSWTVDRTEPDTSIAMGPVGTTSSTTATFTFTSTEPGSTFECSLDGGAFSPCPAAHTLSGLADGSHTLAVRSIDPAGNVDSTPATRTWTVDTSVPDTTITSAPSGTVNVSTASITFTSNEPGATFECSLDGAAFAACPSPHALSALNDGLHTIAVRAVDAAGNVDPTPATASWTVDASEPDTVIATGPTGSTSATDATFTFTSTKANSTFECSLDGAAFTACTATTTFNNLADGSHTLSVRAIDPGGNVDSSPATRTWTVDTDLPETTIVTAPPAFTNSSSASFTFSSDETGATFECSLDGAVFAACPTPHALMNLSNGLHVLLVRAVDTAGNIDASPAVATWTVDTVAPNVPLITEPVENAVTGALPRFGGMAEPGSTVTVTVNGNTVCTATATSSGTWSCTGTTPLAAGMQTATATSTDAAGNVSMPSLPRAFTVDTGAPDTVITSAPPALTNSGSATFNFAADRMGATFECSLDGAAFTACTPSTLMVADGTHRLEVRAVSNGVVDPSPAVATWTVDTMSPAAPVITSPTANSTTSSTPTFTGTSEPGATVSVSLDGTVICTVTADANGNFSCAAPSALSSGAHSVTATATDPAGNVSQPSTPVPFTVDASLLDTAIIAGPSGTVRSTTADFAFTSTVLGSSFECSLDGAAFVSCNTPTTFTGLSDGQHTLEVRAVNGTNTDSTPATRTWTIDSTAPMPPVVTTPADGSTVYTRTPRFSGTAEPGSTVRVSVDDQEVCTAITGTNGMWTCDSTTTLAAGDHRVSATATDAAGNVSAPSVPNDFTIVIPNVMVAITSPADGTLTKDSTPTITGTATPGSTVTVFVDGMAIGTTTADAMGNWTFTPTTPLADGEHTITARAEFMGYTSPTSGPVKVTIDTRPPMVTTTTDQPNTETPPVITFTSDEPNVTYECSIDGGEFKPCSSPFDTTPAGDGNHSLVVRATDAAGNSSETTVTWTVTAPIVTERPNVIVRGGGCGCGTTENSAFALFGMAALLLLARRRERRAPSPRTLSPRERGPLRRGARFLPLAALIIASGARAQVAGFEVERLDLNPGASTGLITPTGDVMQRGQWRVSLVGHYQHDPLVLFREDTNQRVGSIVGSRITAHLMGAWAPVDWLEVGLQLPIVAFQRGDDLNTWGVNAISTAGMGTPWVTGRFALLKQANKMPLDLAVQLGIGLPFGSPAAYTQVNPLAVAPRVSAGRDFTPWLRLGTEVGFIVRGSAAGSPGPGITENSTASTFTWAVSALGTHAASKLRGELTVRGLVDLTHGVPGTEVLLGVRYPVHKWVEIFALGGPGFGALPGTPAFRAMAGVAVGPPIEPAKPVCDATASDEVLRRDCSALDLDADGVLNANDQCLRVPGAASRQGCTIPDTDGDGLHDEDDQCVKEPGPRERKGCPIRDRDKDTVEDAVDACPDEAGPVERNGCPVRDRDGDTVEDDKDECPDEAGLVERRGCPVKDGDQDGVEDVIDNCPTVKGAVDNAGCPEAEKQLVVISGEKLVIKEKVFFATGKSVVLPRSFKLLDNVAKVLTNHPEVELVRIEGHTDSQGKHDKNVKLSQARAEAVKAYLVKKGVAPERLKPVGFGPDQPTATNDTPEGREQNRRVEFNFEHLKH